MSLTVKNTRVAADTGGPFLTCSEVNIRSQKCAGPFIGSSVDMISKPYQIVCSSNLVIAVDDFWCFCCINKCRAEAKQ